MKPEEMLDEFDQEVLKLLPKVAHELTTKEVKTIAYRITKHALDKGILKRRPCICGALDNLHAHHPDYTKPLRVIWRCAKCHSKIHKKHGEAKTV